MRAIAIITFCLSLTACTTHELGKGAYNALKQAKCYEDTGSQLGCLAGKIAQQFYIARRRFYSPSVREKKYGKFNQK